MFTPFLALNSYSNFHQTLKSPYYDVCYLMNCISLETGNTKYNYKLVQSARSF